ncbi:MAG: hypothetical protein AAGD11_11430 [Planctomycetota bacterium]
MRALSFAIALTCWSVICQVAVAQPIAPRALYNPANGGIWFDQLDAIVSDGRGRLHLLTASDGNIQKRCIVGVNGIELEISAAGPTTPISYNDSTIGWQLEGPFNGPIVEPVFAGFIIVPGTQPSEIFFQAFAGRINFGTTNPVRIPEPGSLLLVLCGGACCVALGRRLRLRGAEPSGHRTRAISEIL